MNRKAVFLDVDGTLVNDRGLIPDSARVAVKKARANGHRVLLCTGRSVAVIFPEILEVGFDGVVASAGGHVEYGGRVLLQRHVHIDHVRHIIDFFDTHGVEYFLESGVGLFGSANCRAQMSDVIFGAPRDDDTLAELQRGLGGFFDSMVTDADLQRTDIHKAFFLESDLTLDAIRAEFAGDFEVIPGTIPALGPGSGELAVVGVHKATGIEAVIDHLGLSREDTIAFGDGFNDLEMLAYAGVGVAMDNAHPGVKAVADDVTPSPDEDGLYAGFVKYGLI